MTRNIFVALIIALALISLLALNLRKKNNKGIIYKYFKYFNYTLMIHIFALVLQIAFANSNIPSIYFDYFSYVGNSLAPIFLLFVALAYSEPVNCEIKINKLKKLYIIPIIFLIILFTNDFHNLFYKTYSIYLSQTVFGPFLILYSIYAYGLFIIDMGIIISNTVRKSGFFSTQTMLIVVGVALPVAVSIVGYLKIIETNIYYMPLTFSITSVLCYISIFKLSAFDIIPVASKTVLETMSDAYVVISKDGSIADSNRMFKKIFEIDEKNKNVFQIFEERMDKKYGKFEDLINECIENGNVIKKEISILKNEKEMFFEVDINPISAVDDKKEFIAFLIVLKDITQHKEDIDQIEEKQDIIVKQQQLVSIGELAGGVAHDINTPISAIKTGIKMLDAMGKDKTPEEKEILERMDNCASKIINIVNSMRNQIRNLGGTTKVKFKISSVLKDIKTITYHEVKKNNSEVNINIADDVEVIGDPTKLGQVLTNLIVNAAQAYDEKGGKINIIVTNNLGKNALINVIDYAGGMPKEVAEHVFKNILTTKGSSGTGLGLYLAYSVIKGEFNGEIDFNSKEGEGTTFSIKIPLADAVLNSEETSTEENNS